MNISKQKIQVVKELHRPARKNFPTRRIVIKGLNETWQADLAQFDFLASENKKYKFLLVVIDCFSKYVWARPLKSKTGSEVTHAFQSILNDRTPKNLQTDQGKEFFNSHFQNLMKKYSINHYHTFSSKKAAIVERVIKTLKNRLYLEFSLNGNYKWIDIIQRIVDEYNHTKHSTIRMKPSDVNKTNENSIMKNSYNFMKIAGQNKLVVGDVVRISRYKHVFDKNYHPNWTTELFKIIEVKITNPVTYLLEDMEGRPIKGAFYEQELQKTKQPDVYLVEKILRKKGDKVLVKWLGFDKSHNSWIHRTNRL